MSEVWKLPGGALLYNVHHRSDCAGRTCVAHNPSRHHMRGWDLNWRDDRGYMERRCPHGFGHPDPDDIAFQRLSKKPWMGEHACDGCCTPPATVVVGDG